MHQRPFANTDRNVSEIGLGCWQLGADWGSVSESDAMAILEAAVEHGVTFIDTADVYGDGRSETIIGKFLQRRSEDLLVATKVGRKNFPGPYTEAGLRQQIEQGRARLGVDTVDLLQLHCLPPDVMRDGEVFNWLRGFRRDGLIREFGASVETVQEALLILDQPQLASVQVIFNVFRHKPAVELFDEAAQRKIAIIVRLPLASGLLAGKFTKQTTFAEDDHRHYNRDGDVFNVGETFAGLPFSTGVDLVDMVNSMVPSGMTMAQFSQRWILDHPAVTTVITGASSAQQSRDNAAVSDLPPLPESIHLQLRQFYQTSVHDAIRGIY